MKLQRLRSALLAGMVAITAPGCDRPAPGPAPGSAEYEETLSAFHTGVAAIQVGEHERAQRSLTRVAELAPEEPAAAANLALLALQQRRLDDAAEWIARARSHAGDDPHVRFLAGLIARERDQPDEAIALLREAFGLESYSGATQDGAIALRGRFLLAELLEERGGPDDLREARALIDAAIERDTSSSFLRVASARMAARRGTAAMLQRDVAALERHAVLWPEPERIQLERVRATLGAPEGAGTELTFLAGALDALPSYAADREAFTVAPGQPDLVVARFLRLPMPGGGPSEPDLALAWDAAGIAAPAGVWTDVQPVWFGSESAARFLLSRADGLWIGGSGDARQLTAAAGPVASLDYDHDFRMDIAIAGRHGLVLLQQEADDGYSAVERNAFSAQTREREYTGVWAADADVDGDMDLVLAPLNATPVLLRNLGNGTFAEVPAFDSSVPNAVAFAWADLSGDGVGDAAFLDSEGGVHVLVNPRQDRPRFVRATLPSAVGRARAFAVGDLDADGTFGLIVLRRDGSVVHAWAEAGEWRVADRIGPGEAPAGPDARLMLADLDNNGALDVVVSGGGTTRSWLAGADDELVAHATLDVAVTAAADIGGRGTIDLLGIGADGNPVRLLGRPTLGYNAITLSPRAADQPGDRRVNTFGIGGTAEIRAGTLYQKQPILAPVVHFGIGARTGVNVARIIWPNGTAQAEFDLLATQGGQPIVAPQRLKGSCPWLFSFDGERMSFVTDVIWRTALGLRINTYGASSVIHSEDWVRIRGDQLAPRDGAYELSITAELWESHFFDHVSLMVVDHPVGTEVFVDERFAMEDPPLELHATGALRPLASAHDDAGNDITALVAARDERYADTFELGRYQGVAPKHFVEVDLGPVDATPANVPLLLIAHGWLYPTDGSINFAIGQGAADRPAGVRVEVPDGRGGWSVLHPDLGMPAGKTKTVLIDLAGAFEPGTPRRVRLHTSMEIYWDHIGWTEAEPDTDMRVARLLPERADLRYRGFSETRQAGRRAPELPDYTIAHAAPIWQDLEGHHTRFGDVLPLLQHVDDRYVIMNAGDEIVLRFAAPPPPADGWVRDYVFVSDGWAKDGDYNNGFSSTLLPLPYHGLTDYSKAPGRLQDDPAFRMHPEDWRDYHTRYVSPRAFTRALSR
ncbi:MAG: CRTAC1 family protein [Gemmatimonadota bacterium]